MTSKKGLPKGKAGLLKEYASPRKKYEFSLDDDEILQQKGDVGFFMELNHNADPNKIRSRLELIAEGKTGYVNYLPNIGVLVCVTDKATYESISGIRLEKVERENQNIQDRYTTQGYREITSPTVPAALKNEVRAMHLNYVN